MTNQSKDYMDFNPLIIIPAYNVESSLQQVIEQLPKSNTLVVDDGSIDNSADIAIKEKVLFLKHNTNRGLSSAIYTGISYAIKNKFSHVLLMDGDGQHPPDLFTVFFNKMRTNDFVLGDRFSYLKPIPKQKIASNLFASLIIEHLTGVFIRDVSCGYRGFKLSDEFIIYDCRGYSFIYAQTLKYLNSDTIPARVNVPALYDLNKPLVTRIEEVESLYNSLLRINNNDDLIRTFGKFISKKKDIHISLKKCEFYARYIKESNSYFFETDHSTAEIYYGN